MPLLLTNTLNDEDVGLELIPYSGETLADRNFPESRVKLLFAIHTFTIKPICRRASPIYNVVHGCNGMGVSTANNL